jgi:hypothetical protein
MNLSGWSNDLAVDASQISFSPTAVLVRMILVGKRRRNVSASPEYCPGSLLQGFKYRR